MNDEDYLRLAIEQSALAAERNEYPYGAVLVRNGEVVLRGYNSTRSTKDIAAHAELSIVREAGQKMDESALAECSLYTSCESCVMCAGAIYWAGIKKVVYGCPTEIDAKISEMPFAVPCRSLLIVPGGHDIEVVGPLLQVEATAVLEAFWSKYLREHQTSFGLSV